MASERTVSTQVRAKVSQRDGPCRIGKNLLASFFGRCAGVPEWAHLGDKRRFKTRGMEPEDRHTTQGTAMLCTAHHSAYDLHLIDIQPLTPAGADGPLSFIKCETVFEEQT